MTPPVTAPARRRQPLTVGAVDCPAEREADAVARTVVSVLRSVPIAATTSDRVRRSTADVGASLGLSPIGADGGVLNADMSDRIDGERRRGMPMPPRIRRRFEGALGADLGAVRVHTGRRSDELNAALGATAFTSGSDVFFRGGLPDVSAPSGQHVLAHELTHVVQQRGAESRIRRAVGFEFEVGSWTLERIDRSLSWQETGGYTPIPNADVDPYAGTIAKAGPLEFTGDQSDDGSTHIEWVMTKPVEETDAGRAELERTMDRLEALNNALIAKRDKAKIKRSNEDNNGMISHRYRGQTVGLPKNVLVQPWGELRGEPQMTAGIALDRVFRLMENLSSTKRAGESTKQHRQRMDGSAVLMGKGVAEIPAVAGGPAAVRTAFGNVPHTGIGAPKTPSRELVGFVSLMRTYILGAAKNKSYAKAIVPFLLKTDYAKLFTMLPEAAYYKANPDVFERFVLESAGLTVADAGTPLFSGDISYISQRGVMDDLKTLTKGIWINAITGGHDYCTPKELSNSPGHDAAEHLFGFGALGDKTDTVGPAGKETDDSAIMEFRRLAGSLPHDRWKPFALALFDYVREINANKKGRYGGEGYYG